MGKCLDIEKTFRKMVQDFKSVFLDEAFVMTVFSKRIRDGGFAWLPFSHDLEIM